MKPVIGVTPSMEVAGTEYKTNKDYIEAITQMGGIPLILPYLTDEVSITTIIEKIDGLYATGGYDIDPTLFGEEPHPQLGTIIPERDEFETLLIKELLKEKKPLLAVCRGAQILNIVVGGDMYQDINEQIDTPLIQHQQSAPSGHGSHFVTVEKNSLLYNLTKTEQLKVNSRHHQANRHVPDSYLISGRSSDGVIEAIESKADKFVLGLQWHPENMFVKKGDQAAKKIFKGFITACEERMNLR